MDVQVRDEGSIWLLTPRSLAACDWIAEHVDDDAHWFAGGLVVEHRYVADIIQGMAHAGLQFEVL